MGRQEVVFESKLLLKLSRLNMLRRSMSSKDNLSPSASSKNGENLSVLASLSSLLAAGSDKASIKAEHEEKDSLRILYQTAQEQYASIVQDDRPKTPPLHIFGDSQILTARQLKELRHVR